jgi:hypothetical protein
VEREEKKKKDKKRERKFERLKNLTPAPGFEYKPKLIQLVVPPKVRHGR